MPVDRQHWDILVCGAYKWLLSPRGTAFMAIKPDLMDDVTPINANWYAGESPWDSSTEARYAWQRQLDASIFHPLGQTG